MIESLYTPFRHWSERGAVWLYSDTHFGDKNLGAGIPERPDDDEQVRRINAKCGKKDTLILLGDVGDIECVKKLKGYKVLICGNHDVGHTIYNKVFDEVYEGPLFISPKILLSHEPVDIPFALNIHGHDHSGSPSDELHLNVCADVVKYTPVSLNQIIRDGRLAVAKGIHRITIDEATLRHKMKIEGEER